MKPLHSFLTDEDLQYQFRFMVRWCRLFHKTALDWVNLEAERFRERYPVLPVGLEPARIAALPAQEAVV